MHPDARPIPRYAELPTLGDTGEHHSWDVFGREDELGTLNFLRPATIAAAAQRVRDGRVICLSLPLNVPYPATTSGRPPYTHTVTRSRMGRDDSLDGFFLQCSSQWDSLQHIRFREFGYYGGREEAALDRGALGMDVMARRGIVGRGILIDAERHFRTQGSDYAANRRIPITPAQLDAMLEAQGTIPQHGDILILRTGWVSWYLGLDPAGRAALQGTQRAGDDALQCAGLAPSATMAAWLWDHHISAVAADNPALEVLSVHRDDGFLHRRILTLLGMPIGEFFLLDELAEACAARRDWSFLFTSAPLNLPNGVGSPNNAYAIL
ncbi:MAG: cyclase family protein [Acetobacteraceae bacterium]